MGLPAHGDPVESCSKRFANDVLKIEISGPEERHLSFVDLPGLYHSGLTEYDCYLLCCNLTPIQIRHWSRQPET